MNQSFSSPFLSGISVYSKRLLIVGLDEATSFGIACHLQQFCGWDVSISERSFQSIVQDPPADMSEILLVSARDIDLTSPDIVDFVSKRLPAIVLVGDETTTGMSIQRARKRNTLPMSAIIAMPRTPRLVIETFVKSGRPGIR